MLRLSRMGMLLPSLIVLSSFVGCTTFHTPFAKKMPRATAIDPAVEIVCLWQPGEGSDPDGVPCKGFMGQILFLSRSSSTPVQIEGEVRIYLFDDQGTQEEQAKPLRVFNFDNGSWALHLTDSSFGPTYQVFVPYVRRGVSNANCSMRVRLKPKQGHAIFSDFTNMPLTGHKKTLRGDEAKPINQEEVDRLASEAMSTDLLRTTTISLGPNSKTSESPKTAKKESNSGQIQLAAYEAESEPAPANAEADRIRRLEAMVQQLLEQKSQAAATPAQVPPRRPMFDQKRSESEPDDETSTQERIKLNPRKKLRRDENEEVQRNAPRRLNHPLVDDHSYESESQLNMSQHEESEEESSSDPVDSRIDSSPRFNLQDQRNQRYGR